MRKSSSEGSEGFADYDDQSSDGKSSDGDNGSQSSGELMAGSEDSDKELEMPTLMRMSSMQIGNEYSYVVINQ